MRKLYTVICLFVTLLSFVFTPVKTNATTYTIQAVDNLFVPNVQNAVVGDTIIFEWIGPVRIHTATSTSVPVGADPFDSPLNAGTPTFIYPLTVEGVYNYECQFHAPAMSGIINVAAGGPVTYVWNRTDSADFQVAANWTPDRTTPAVDDILVFNNGATGSIIYNIPTTQTIAGFQVTGNTFVRITNGATTLITIDGGSGPNFVIDAGSTLELSGAATKDSIAFNLATGTTASISGNFTMKSFGGTPGHRFRVKDASGATFNSGAIFTFGPNAAGNAFGVINSGFSGNSSVLFASGSRFISRSGANPFAQSAPASFVVFQTGSTYDHQQSGAPSLSGRTFANFEYNNAATNSGTGGGTLTLDNLTVNDGIFNINLTGRINIKGNISVAAGKTLTFSPASGDSLFLNGTSQQTISGAGTLTFAANSRVIIQNSNHILLTRDVAFLGELNMKSGNIVSDNWSSDPVRTVTIGTSPASTGTLVRTDGMIIAWVKRFLPASISGTPVLFPTGFDNSGTTYYKPMTINFTSAPSTGGSLTARSYYSFSGPISQDPPTGGMDITPLIDGAFTVNRAGMMYWETAVSGITDGTYDISIDANGQTGITDPTLLRVVYRADAISAFTLQGTHTPGTGSSVANRTGISGNTFGLFYAGGNTTNNPLPVELDNFVATTIKNEVILDWATGHELNNNGFEIQRAALVPGQKLTEMISVANYQTVGYVQSKGNSNLVQTYKYNDKNLQSGLYTYRLKQIDHNGNYSYFLLDNEVFVNTPGKFFISQNYPNPFNPVTSINYEMPFEGTVSLIVYDNLGREVKTLVNGNIAAGYYKVDFNASGLPSGIYFYRVNASSNSQKFEKVFKMMLIK